MNVHIADDTTPTMIPIQPGSMVGRLWRAPFFSPVGLWLRAVLITLAYGVAEIIGLRSCTCVLTGTSPTGNPADWFTSLLGFVYFVIYLAWVFVVPVLIISGALLAAALYWWGRTDRPQADVPTVGEGARK